MGRMSRAVVSAALLMGFFTANAHATTVGSPNVTISGVFAGGGVSGAPYKNDYIELFNHSSSSVDLTGWTVQWEAGSNPFAGGTSLSGSIAAHSYYLVGEASGGGNGAALPTPDATGAIAIDGSSGKARVLDGSSNVIDLVGYFANEYEGNAFPGSIGTDSALERKRTGCVDTDDNDS